MRKKLPCKNEPLVGMLRQEERLETQDREGGSPRAIAENKAMRNQQFVMRLPGAGRGAVEMYAADTKCNKV